MSEEANVEAQENSAPEITETLLPESGEVQTGWKFAEGVDGMGEKPEWFADKFETVADQAKAYRELESRFGSFTGAPKDGYKVELGEGLKDKGVELDKDSPFLEKAMETAKELGMSNDGFNRMVELYMTDKLAEKEAMDAYNKQYMEEQMKELGSNANKILADLADFGRANLPNELYKPFEGMITSADSARVMAHLMDKLQSAPIAPDATSAPGFTKADVREMQFKTNENGERLIKVDPDFRAEYERKAKAVFGEGEYRVEVG